MAKLSKRARLHSEKIEVGKAYPIEEAVQILTELASAKFCESVDVASTLVLIHVNLIKLLEAQLCFLTVQEKMSK